jgi:hypothetical protein
VRRGACCTSVDYQLSRSSQQDACRAMRFCCTFDCEKYLGANKGVDVDDDLRSIQHQSSCRRGVVRGRHSLEPGCRSRPAKDGRLRVRPGSSGRSCSAGSRRRTAGRGGMCSACAGRRCTLRNGRCSCGCSWAGRCARTCGCSGSRGCSGSCGCGCAGWCSGSCWCSAHCARAGGCAGAGWRLTH